MELPSNEAERLAALISYGILDTDFEETFDRVTRLAAQLFRTPISLITLLDQNRQWFKSAVGLHIRETPRALAFCSHTILGTDVLVVPDAAKDPRFTSHPLVTGEPHVRFYAGAPILDAEGFALGTVCVIDRTAHSVLTRQEKSALADFAGLVADLLEARRQARELKRMKAH